jgi:uncharacterized protein YjbI with pentapeptide repeats
MELTNLSSADLRSANLSLVNLITANLKNTKLRVVNVNLEDASRDSKIILEPGQLVRDIMLFKPSDDTKS